MNLGTYILDERGAPVPCDDFLEWAAFVEEHRRLASDVVPGGGVSTIFLGVDVSAAVFDRAPRLWETMVFASGSWNGHQERYASRAEALAGHQRVVEAIRQGKPREN